MYYHERMSQGGFDRMGRHEG
jgi:hypothetical protein